MYNYPQLYLFFAFSFIVLALVCAGCESGSGHGRLANGADLFLPASTAQLHLHGDTGRASEVRHQQLSFDRHGQLHADSQHGRQFGRGAVELTRTEHARVFPSNFSGQLVADAVMLPSIWNDHFQGRRAFCAHISRRYVYSYNLSSYLYEISLLFTHRSSKFRVYEVQNGLLMKGDVLDVRFCFAIRVELFVLGEMCYR